MTDDRSQASERRGTASELGVWSALYVAGVAFMVGQTLLGSSRPAWGVEAYCFLIGLGVYLLDRVGVRRPDPADGAPWPTGTRRRRLTRVAALICLVVASAVGWVLRPGLALGPWIGLVVVAAYAWPGPWRLKAHVALKGPIVAICLVALGIVASGADRVLAHDARAWITAIGLVLVVLGDCVLSDLDDADADRAAGGGSVAAIVGPRAARTVALACHVGAGGSILLGSGLARSAAVWSGIVVLTTGLLVVVRPARVRTIVDLRLPILAAAVWGLIEMELVAPG
ncbi:MAG: UbiA family prenyltransferase [Phycisphaerales bacterium]